MTLTREQWLEARQSGITGAGASAIMGASPYMSSVDYWLEKTGRREASDISDNARVQYGLDAEQHLIELFKLDFPQYKVIHHDFDLRRHPEIPYLIGSLDGELVEKFTGRRGVLEVKTTEIMSSAQNQQWQGGIPMHFFWQVLHYLLVTGFDFVVLKAQLKFAFDGSIRLETRHYQFDRSEVQTQLDELAKKEIAFWAHVQNRTKPPLILPRI